ncbi:hypothetical protein [Streptomyces sp. NPDC021212]|uniref:hypothetical protein n=1 Tax=Streptomyces sp. NPDC021212 TaxID=3365118 RepID=UPI0037BBFEB6
MLVALTIACVMIWISYKPQLSTRAQDRTEEAAATAVPTPKQPVPSSAPTSKPEADPTQKPGDDDAGGGGGGGDAKPTTPPEDPFARVLLRKGTTQKCAAPVEEQGKVDGETAQYPCDGAQNRPLWDLETVFEGKGPNNADLVRTGVKRPGVVHRQTRQPAAGNAGRTASPNGRLRSAFKRQSQPFGNRTTKHLESWTRLR